MHLPLRLVFLLVAGAVLCSAAGCGGGTYELKFDSALQAAQHRSQFAILFDNPTQLYGVPIEMRLPKLAWKQLRVGGADPESESVKVPPDRSKPPYFMDMQDVGESFLGTLEVRDKVGTDELPFSVSFWAYDPAKVPAAGVLRWIEERVKKVFPKAGGWQDLEAETPEVGPNAKKIKWKRIQGSGQPGKFYVKDETGLVVPKVMNETFELWVREPEKDDKSQYLLILVWRTPDEAAEKFELSRNAERAAGTLVINEKPGEAEQPAPAS